MYWPDDGSAEVVSVVAGPVDAVVGGAVVAVVGGAVVAVGLVVGVGRVDGDVVDGGVVLEGVDRVGVVVALVSVELSDPASPESVERLLSAESVPPEPLFDFRPFDFLPDFASDDLPSGDF